MKNCKKNKRVPPLKRGKVPRPMQIEPRRDPSGRHKTRLKKDGL
jgi:hypothetical protein